MRKRICISAVLITLLLAVNAEARMYNAVAGRWMSRDPIGETSDPNLYRAMENNPVNNIDPLGLIQWNGTAKAFGITLPFGALGMKFNLKSEWVQDSGGGCSKQAEITVFAAGPAIGVGIKASGTESPVTFEDYDNNLNPNNFNGVFRFAGAGAAFGWGGSSGQIQLGKAFSQGALSPAIGIDWSAMGSWFGSSGVFNLKYNYK